MDPSDADLEAALPAWLPGQRWFPGGHRDIRGVRILSRTPLTADAWHICLGVRFEEAWETYQVPVVVGADGLTDGLAHPDVVNSMLARHGSPGTHWIDTASGCATFRLLNAEQTNTSVICDDVLIKFFRRLQPGTNPDIEVLAALTERGSTGIVPLRGWIDGHWTDPDSGRTVTGQFAMIGDYLPDARDGGQSAIAAAREDRSFAAQAEELGRTLARIHEDLAGAFGTSAPIDPRPRLHARLDAATAVPEVARLSDRLHRQLDMADVAGPAQRIHGDLHLGQTIHTADGWRVLDFEGEPAANPADRRAPDHPLRDVACMVRSFDYGARICGDRMAWRDECVQRFVDGYVGAGGFDPARAPGLYTAYLIDKAAYEALYEQRHRADWKWIPLAALVELAGE